MNMLAKISGLALLLGLAQQALANPCPPGNPPTNCAPPSGPVILDLAGTPVPHSQALYSANFTAGLTSTQISFAFREDPAFLEMSDVSLVDTTTHSGNLLLNGDFLLGTLGSDAVDWVHLNTFGARAAGVVRAGCGFGGSPCWYDGSVQGYDGLNQTVATTIGDSYTLSFWLDDNGGLTTFQQLSTNGDTTDPNGNGIDLLAYAGAGIPHEGPPSVPEPTTLALLGIGGLAGFGFVRRRRARA